jgi:hypothetical protein
MAECQEFIAALDPEKQAVVQVLRDAALAVSTGISEGIKWDALCFFKGDRAFVGLMPYRNYVSVIFDRGSEMADDLGVLEGNGKQMRHIKIRKLEEIEQKKVSRYIYESYFIQEK